MTETNITVILLIVTNKKTQFVDRPGTTVLRILFDKQNEKQKLSVDNRPEMDTRLIRVSLIHRRAAVRCM